MLLDEMKKMFFLQNVITKITNFFIIFYEHVQNMLSAELFVQSVSFIYSVLQYRKFSTGYLTARAVTGFADFKTNKQK